MAPKKVSKVAASAPVEPTVEVSSHNQNHYAAVAEAWDLIMQRRTYLSACSIKTRRRHNKEHVQMFFVDCGCLLFM